jgi:hypothetical protein
MIWWHDDSAQPNLPSPAGYGWELEDDDFIPTPTPLPPAPDAIIQLVKCGCKKTNCLSHCSCRLHNLACTELCLCGADDDTCTNTMIQRFWGLDEDDNDADLTL